MKTNEPITETEKQLLDNLVTKFYSTFTNSNGRIPDLNTVRETCISKIIIIKKMGPDEEIYTLSEFIKPRTELLSNGSLVNFEEKETAETTTITGHIAQRHSSYTKKGVLNGSAFEQNGTKLFQFIKTASSWKISALVWEDQPA